MLYLAAKSLHIFAAMIWVTGMVAHPWLVGQLVQEPLPRTPATQLLLQRLRVWDRMTTGTGMLLVFVLGLYMAQNAGWFAFTWLRVKFLLAFGLGGLHGVGAGQVRRMAADPGYPGRSWPGVRLVSVLLVAAIVTLAVIKPS